MLIKAVMKLLDFSRFVVTCALKLASMNSFRKTVAINGVIKFFGFCVGNFINDYL